MPSRRTFLRTAGIATAGMLTAGCSTTRSSKPRTIEQMLVQSYQPNPVTIQVLVTCDGQPLHWRTYDLDGYEESTGEVVPGTVVRNVRLPDDYDTCRLHARMDDPEDVTTASLGDHSEECLRLQVTAQNGTLGVYTATNCDTTTGTTTD